MTDFATKRKYKGARFVRFFPSDWRSGCIGLTFEQEGLYIRICSYIYETEHRLPLDDRQAAKLMGAHTNAYRKVRDQLAALGKLTQTSTGWTVGRAERELAAAIGRSICVQETVSERQVDTSSGWDTCQDTLGDTPHNTPPDTRGVFSENANKINTPFIEPITNSHSQEKKDQGAVAEAWERASAMAQSVKAGKVAKSARSQTRVRGELDGSKGIEFSDGRLTVVNGSAAALSAEFPGIDLPAVCNRAGPELARMAYPSHFDAMAVLRKWAQILADERKKARKPAPDTLEGHYVAPLPGKLVPVLEDWGAANA